MSAVKRLEAALGDVRSGDAVLLAGVEVLAGLGIEKVCVSDRCLAGDVSGRQVWMAGQRGVAATPDVAVMTKGWHTG